MTSAGMTVIGADDPLGEAVVREALVRGLSVRATASRPERVPQLSPALQLLQADSEDQPRLETAVRSGDAVILALSPQLTAEPTTRLTDAAIATVRAMRVAGAERLVVASSLELDDARGGPLGPVRRGLHRGGLQDLRRLERLLAGSGVDWTVLRAGVLTDLLGTRRRRVVTLDQGGAPSLSREDLAHALVDQALRPGTEPRVLGVMT